MVASARAAGALYDPLPRPRTAPRRSPRIDALYPDSLAGDLERHRELAGEQAMLQALRDGVLNAPGGVIRYRGEEIPRKQLGEVIDRVRGEVRDAEEAVLRHDRGVPHRPPRRRAAARSGVGGLPRQPRRSYCITPTTPRRTSATRRYMHHVLGIVLADGRVTKSERARLIRAAEDVWVPLSQNLSAAAAGVVAGRGGAGAREGRLGRGPLRALRLPDAAPREPRRLAAGVGQLGARRRQRVGGLASATLEVLLEAEDHLAKCVREELDPGEAPEPAKVPDDYVTLVLGEERERQKKLGWWDRFVLADGFVPGAARFAVATGVLVPALVLGGSVGGDAELTVYNGLGVPVNVAIEGEHAFVPAHASQTVDVPREDGLTIVATTLDGREIHRLEADVDHAWADYVYSVAGAAPMIEWTATYGSRTAPPERRIGAPRWLRTDADVLFRDPPRSVSTSSGSSGATRDVLTGLSDRPPDAQLSVVDDPEERRRLIEAHLRWDPPTDPSLGTWLAIAPGELGDALAPIVEARAAGGDGRVLWARMQQDVGDEAARAAACARDRGAADAAPDDPDAVYLALRCEEDPTARGEGYLAAHARHPDHPWLTMAAAYEVARQGQWLDASRLFDRVHRTPELAPLWPGLAVEAARIRRIAAPDPSRASLSDLAQGSPGLSALIAFESGQAPDPTVEARLRPWRLLASGQLTEAVAAADGAVRAGTLDSVRRGGGAAARRDLPGRPARARRAGAVRAAGLRRRLDQRVADGRARAARGP